MKRVCLACGRKGIKVSKLMLPGPAACAYCGAEHVKAQYRNVPYMVAGGLLIATVGTWILGVFNRGVFIAVLAIWLVFDSLWGRFIPLQLVDNGRDVKEA